MSERTPWPECPTCEEGTGMIIPEYHDTGCRWVYGSDCSCAKPCRTCAAHWKGVDEAVNAAVKAEREACVAAIAYRMWTPADAHTFRCATCSEGRIHIHAIRARGGKGEG